MVSYLKSVKLYSALIHESINSVDQSAALPSLSATESTVKPPVKVKSSNESTADQTVKSETESSAAQVIAHAEERVKCFFDNEFGRPTLIIYSESVRQLNKRC